MAQVNNPELKKQRKKRDLFTDTTTKAPITTVCHGLPASSETCMNGSSESRKEATDRKMEVLSAKTKTRIGFWNPDVRTMYETGKLLKVTAEMRRYKLHILGVNESRWTGS